MTAEMNHILSILYFLTLSVAISGKSIPVLQNNVADYLQRYATDPKSDAQFGYSEDQLNVPLNSKTDLNNPGNFKVVEYATDDFSQGFNTIVQKLAASLTEQSALFGPLPLPLPPVNPLINPLHYGFGPPGLAPTSAGGLGEIQIAPVTVTGRSIPWDNKSRSFGGWKPLDGPFRKAPQAMIVMKKYINGQLYKVKSKPINLVGKTIIIKRRPDTDD